MKENRILEWVDELSSGDVALDNQTKDFLRNSNTFFDMKESAYKEEKLEQTLGALTDYSRNYFPAQEETMKKTGYPGIEDHVSEHRRFIRALSKLYKELLTQKKPLKPEDDEYDVRGIDGVINDACDFILDWYDNHMLSTDKRLIDYLKYEFTPKASSERD